MCKNKIGTISIYLKDEVSGVSKDTVAYTFVAKIQDELQKPENKDLKDRLMLNMRDLTEILEDLVDRVIV